MSLLFSLFHIKLFFYFLFFLCFDSLSAMKLNWSQSFGLARENCKILLTLHLTSLSVCFVCLLIRLLLLTIVVAWKSPSLLSKITLRCFSLWHSTATGPLTAMACVPPTAHSLRKSRGCSYEGQR